MSLFAATLAAGMLLLGNSLASVVGLSESQSADASAFTANPRTSEHALAPDASSKASAKTPKLPKKDGPNPSSTSSAPTLTQDASKAPAEPPSDGARRTHWVAPFRETEFWPEPTGNHGSVGTIRPWTALQVIDRQRDDRLPIWDPTERRKGWVTASDVGPIDPALVGTAVLPPIGRRVAWSGAAQITMYTCIELDGCNATASGHWPRSGMVAVDPRVIPLGSTVWVEGLGTFLAADTGSAVRGTHLDVFNPSYADALAWGVQQRTVIVFERD
ncbi:MAG: 3D domain-containing protein [Chloroflexi bacterium]|nr:3D domain-containing protein [Chloroflexota bacterium]